jgi:hypothetical protein
VLIFSIFGFADMRNWQSKRLEEEQRLDSKDKEKLQNTIEKLAKQDNDVN